MIQCCIVCLRYEYGGHHSWIVLILSIRISLLYPGRLKRKTIYLCTIFLTDFKKAGSYHFDCFFMFVSLERSTGEPNLMIFLDLKVGASILSYFNLAEFKTMSSMRKLCECSI